jgi:hypothetical protein
VNPQEFKKKKGRERRTEQKHKTKPVCCDEPEAGKKIRKKKHSLQRKNTDRVDCLETPQKPRFFGGFHSSDQCVRRYQDGAETEALPLTEP